MFKARLHPEQISNTFSDEQIDRLHDAIIHVIDTAIENDAEKARFPSDWLFAHRKAGKLPTGEKIVLLKVGGRTSAVVPSLQIKTGAVAGDVGTPVKVQTPKANVVKPEVEDDDADTPLTSKSKKRKATVELKQEVKKENVKPSSKTRRKSN
jgi:hypothetical protein